MNQKTPKNPRRSRSPDGSAEAVIGRSLRALGPQPGLFSATKVWTSSGDDGPDEIEASRRLWGVDRFDLLQVHNLLAWEAHLETLFDMKEQGRLRYVGITTSHGRRHRDIEHVMQRYPIDFVQATYNVVDREVEQRHETLRALEREAFLAQVATLGEGLEELGVAQLDVAN